MKKILFVCTGNTCRSPMAMGLAQKEFKKRGQAIEFFSRGLAVFAPSGVTENTFTVMQQYNIDLSEHQAHQIQQEDVEVADLVLTMTNQHKAIIIDIYPEWAYKIFTLKEYVEDEDLDIVDPFGGDQTVYEMSAKEIHEKVIQLTKKLK